MTKFFIESAFFHIFTIFSDVCLIKVVPPEALSAVYGHELSKKVKSVYGKPDGEVKSAKKLKFTP